MKQIAAKDFIDGDLRAASLYFNQRAFPHLMDGQKKGRRKILATALTLKQGEKLKVSSLGSRTIDRMAYHHGDASIGDTIVNMAQDFPGTNNVGLLEPAGGFGSALSKDGAAARYIYTRLSDGFHKYFRKEDLSIVTPLFDDGEEIEPEFYIPMIPMILVNGAEAPGTGYKSNILLYNPEDLVRAVKEVASTGAVVTPLVPWMRGWKGKVEKDVQTRQATFYGVAEVVNKTKVMITEVPPREDLQSVKARLNDLIDKGIIKDYTNRGSDKGQWKIELQVARDFSDKYPGEKMLEVLGLRERMTENLVCWGVNGELLIFETVEALVVKWYEERLKLAAKSLENRTGEVKEEHTWLRVKLLFLAWWADHSEEVVKWSKSDIQQQIVKDIELLSQNTKYLTRLTDIRIFGLAKDEKDMLHTQIQNCEKEITRLGTFTPASWYLSSLNGGGSAC